MKNKFLQISIGISIMLLSAGFLLRSIGSANASTLNNPPFPAKLMDNGNSSQNGRFTFQYVYEPPTKDANGNFVYAVYEYIIMDTQTGKAVIYDYNVKNNAYSWSMTPGDMPVNTLNR